MIRPILHFVALLLPAVVCGQTTPATRPAEQIPDRVTLEKRFEQTLTGAALVGRATDSRRPDAHPAADRYVIDSVAKVPGDDDQWRFNVRMSVRGREVIIPLIIPVRFAGDTPVISVTDLAVPMMGTYSARVVVYRDYYAGTWNGLDYGGHIYGKIERAGTPTTHPATQPAP